MLDYEALKKQIQLPEFFSNTKDLSPRDHAQLVDDNLGFKIIEIEDSLAETFQPYFEYGEAEKEKLHKETQTWVGLHPQVLQTPYLEIIQFLSKLKGLGVKRFVDLGAGYGRVGLVMNSFFPNSEFVGYEIVKARCDEGTRVLNLLGLENCTMRNENILDEGFELPKADVYFIYDFSDPADIRNILKQLSKRLYKEQFFIVAKGKGIRSMIQVKFPEFWVANGVIHEQEWSLYASLFDLDKLKSKNE